jgi:hypothetical protein
VTEPQDIRELRGLVATVNLTGLIEAETAEALSHIRSHCDRAGWPAIEYRTFYAVLVEAGRDMVVQHALDHNYDWLIMIDGDAAPIPEQLVPYLVNKIFVEYPFADVIGTYCQLKGPPHAPTIDTGTGTWEQHFPNSGMLEVIRTGAHAFIAKMSAYTRFGPPWYKTRISEVPARAFAEVDNFARCKLDGRNPLSDHPEWTTLMYEAGKADMPIGQPIGEDSAFCDALRAHGGRIFVDTDIVVGHITKKLISPSDLKEHVEGHHKRIRMACGLLT